MCQPPSGEQPNFVFSIHPPGINPPNLVDHHLTNHDCHSTPSRVILSITPAASNSIQDPFSDPSALEEVVELCTYLRRGTEPIFGLCLDDCHKLRAYPRDPALQALDGTKSFTLTQILPQVPRQIVNGDTYQLAIALAAAVLQLIETPWLDSTWNKDGILFTRSCSRVDGNVDIKYPLLLRDFDSGKEIPRLNYPECHY